MTISHIWACSCGAETPCDPADLEAGAVSECPHCEQVWGCVRSKPGPKAWVAITDKEVIFHNLLGEEVHDE